MSECKDSKYRSYEDWITQHCRQGPFGAPGRAVYVKEDCLDEEDENESHYHHAQDDIGRVQNALTASPGAVHLGEKERQGHCRRQECETHHKRVRQVIIKADQNQSRHNHGGYPVCDYDHCLLHSSSKDIDSFPKKDSLAFTKRCFGGFDSSPLGFDFAFMQGSSVPL